MSCAFVFFMLCFGKVLRAEECGAIFLLPFCVVRLCLAFCVCVLLERVCAEELVVRFVFFCSCLCVWVTFAYLCMCMCLYLDACYVMGYMFTRHVSFLPYIQYCCAGLCDLVV